MKWLPTLLVPVLLFGCSSKHITTVWKTGTGDQQFFKQVLVVAVLPGNDSIERRKMECEVTDDLNEVGYPSASAITYFGWKGLAGADQESTYIKLCNSGFDYVLTIALVERKENNLRHNRSIMYTSGYYYKRIWDYKNTPAELAGSSRYYYESILFDLSQLKAVSVLRSGLFEPAQRREVMTAFPDRLVKKMIKEKILARQAKSYHRKAF